MAALDIGDLNMRQDQGRSILSFTLYQDAESQPLDLSAPLVVQGPGREKKLRIILAEQSKQVDLALDMPPFSLALDPDYRLPRTLEQDEYPPVLARLFASKNCLVVLGKGADALEPLTSWLAAEGCAIKEQDQVRNQDLGQADILFAGDSDPLREVLASMDLPQEGLALSVRRNPLAPDRIMALAQATARSRLPGLESVASLWALSGGILC